jgi:tRNA pseudouridine55 synthase
LPPDGVLSLNKPRGLTSRQAVSRVAAIARARKAGHAGTLDPMATGVLVVCLGRATLLSSYLARGRKVYAAEALLGVETDTYDTEGEVLARVPSVRVTREEIEAALDAFIGEVDQMPPPYSAVRVGGRRLYEYARKGEPVPSVPRGVRIDSVTLSSLEETPLGPVAGLQITCGPGTYVRSLVHDLGKLLGCGACASGIERRASGALGIGDSVTLEELAADGVGPYLISAEEATCDMPTAHLSGAAAEAVTMGKPILDGTPGLPEGRVVFRVLDGEGRLLALYGPPRDDDEGVAARAVRVLRPYSRHADEAA